MLVKPTGNRGIRSMSIGRGHACALRNDGVARCWGDNDAGQLGHGHARDRARPAQVVGSSAWVEIGVGQSHSCALRYDGTVSCWGSGEHGVLAGAATTPSPLRIALPEAALRLSVGSRHNCVSTVSGRVLCWGSFATADEHPNHVGRVREIRAARGTSALVSGRNHACALRSDGTVLCWGGNDRGQLGDESRTSHSRPSRVSGLRDIEAIFAGADRSCALRNHTMYCWGARFGPGGSDSTRPVAMRVPFEIGDWAIADAHICSSNAKGEIFCWGRNPDGRLGDASLDDRDRPTHVRGLQGTSALAVGHNSTCAGLPDASIACWGNDPHAMLVDAEVLQPPPGRPGVVDDVHAATQISTAGHYACALERGGRVRCWGKTPSSKQRSQRQNDRSTIEHIPSLSDATSVDTGSAHACATRATGTVYCWGDDRYGQSRGLGALTAGPSDAKPLRGGAAITAVATGDRHSCALRADGRVQCWGDDEFGQLGRASAGSSRPDQSLVQGLGSVVELSAGAFHNCARRRDGAVVCWGDNTWGQLGIGSSSSQLSQPVRRPTAVAGLRGARSISAGRDHSCAQLSTGKVWCWGANKDQQLGSSTLADIWTTPVPARGVRNLSRPASGLGSTCALQGSQAYCWGKVGAGLIGPNSPAHAGTPQRAPVDNALQVATGADFACALLRSGEVSCWGADRGGRLGLGPSRFVARPARLAGF